jgi:hypothetical protein
MKKCIKRGYENQGHALSSMQDRVGGLRSYRCRMCKKWHLTHKAHKRRKKSFK